AYAGAPENTVASLERYGQALGIAFQIADDVLDIWGEEGVTGKSLGTDLQQQKLTLPVIRLLSLANPATAVKVRAILTESGPDQRRHLCPYLEESGALDYAWRRARQHVKQALDALDCLNDSPAKSMLRMLAQYVAR